MRRRMLGLILAAWMLLAVPIGALADIIQVSTYQQLIDAAKDCKENDIIELTANLTRKGDETETVAKITKDGVTVRSSDGNQFVISNDTGVTGRLLEVGDSRAPVNDFTLENVDMTGGSTTEFNKSGGALYVNGDNATISHCTFTGNQTTGDHAYGGAVHIYGSGAKIENSTFEQNQTTGTGAYGGGANIWGDNAQVENSTFGQNQTTGEYAAGGGLAIYGSGSTIEGSTFEGNQAAGANSNGGGVAYTGVAPADIKNTDFYNNTSTTGGGAIAGTSIIIWGVNYFEGNTPPGSTPVGVDDEGKPKYVSIQANSVKLEEGAQIIEGRRTDPVPVPINEAQIVGAGPNNRSSLYTVQRNLTIHQTEDPGSPQKGTLPAGTEVTVIQFSSGMALTSKGYVDAGGLSRVTGQ